MQYDKFVTIPEADYRERHRVLLRWQTAAVAFAPISSSAPAHYRKQGYEDNRLLYQRQISGFGTE
jgi:hypothetical protein